MQCVNIIVVSLCDTSLHFYTIAIVNKYADRKGQFDKTSLKVLPPCQEFDYILYWQSIFINIYYHQEIKNAKEPAEANA